LNAVLRRKITILAVLLSLVITIFPALPANAGTDPATVNVQVRSNPNVEVVLAAGASNMDVSNFAGDLKAELLSKYGITDDRVKVTAVQTNEITTKDEFNWQIYDHYYAPNYPTNGTPPAGWPANIPYFYYEEQSPYDSDLYFTEADSADDSLKYCSNRLAHIYSKDKDILFVGYSVPAFKDFMLYPDTIAGKKKIEFTIEESQIDTHTLEGAGFLFNTGITTDGEGVDRMNGYLVIYDYSSAWFDNVNENWVGKKINLYQFSNVDVNAFHEEQSYDISDLAGSGGGITLLASKNSLSTSTTLNIRIEATKNSLKLFEDNQIIYDTTTTDSGITISDTGAYGFGPLVGYGSHYCSSLTYFTYKNITMTTESIKSFLDVIREPEWQDNTRKYLVNLDDDGVTDFANGEKLAEILYRMINLDSSYIGWGLNNSVEGVTPTITNKDQAEQFIKDNNAKGTFIDQSAAETDTYQEGISAIAKYINDSIQTSDSSYILLDEPYSFVFDPEQLNGTWRIDHDPAYFPNNAGAVSWDDQVLTSFPASFGNAGKYSVFYTETTTDPPASEQKVTDLVALWRPVAAFTYDPGTKTLFDASCDPNGTVLTLEWKWKEVNDAAWTSGVPDPSTFSAQGNYLVQLIVQNAEGFQSLPCALYISQSLNALPIAAFTLPSNSLSMDTGTTTITPVNNSYHPSGSPLDEYKWEVYNSQNQLVLNYSDAAPVIDFINLPSDTYSIKLAVRFGTNWSEIFTQTLKVTAPKISFNPNGCSTPKSSASTVVTVDGEDSDYSSLEYQWSTTKDFPTAGTWTTFKNGDTITVSQVSGSYYLHIKAVDNSSNESKATSDQFVLSAAVSADSGGGGVGVVPSVIKTQRLAGISRYETAVAVSQTGWNLADTVVLARGDQYADALAGVPLAFKLNAPILLTDPASLPTATLNEVKRLKAHKVLILGGLSAVSETIAQDLTALGLEVERIAGADRFDTAVQVAQKLNGQDTAVIVNGNNFPDALSAASYAAVKGYPILMTNERNIPSVTLAGIASLGIKHTFIIGEQGVISQTVFNQLPSGVRIGGTNRYATALNLAAYFNASATELFVTTGLDFPDAITGAVVAAKENAGIIYVPGNQDPVPASVQAYIKNNKITELSILGGTGVISENIIQTLIKP